MYLSDTLYFSLPNIYTICAFSRVFAVLDHISSKISRGCWAHTSVRLLCFLKKPCYYLAMGSGKGKTRRAQAVAALAAPGNAQSVERAARLEAYKEVKEIVAAVGAAKLYKAESSTILWAAEGLLLAPAADDPEALESKTAFETLMNDLESHRWAEMRGTPEQPGTARRLRAAFANCAAQE